MTMAVFETPESMAECGDGGGGSPEASVRYQNIEFPIGKHDYTIPMAPVRGNKNISAYTARLKMWSAMSSIHSFRSIAAHFADGSGAREQAGDLLLFPTEAVAVRDQDRTGGVLSTPPDDRLRLRYVDIQVRPACKWPVPPLPRSTASQ